MARFIGDIALDAGAALPITGSLDAILTIGIDATGTVVIARRRRGDGGLNWWYWYLHRITSEKAAEAERLRLANAVDGDFYAILAMPTITTRGSHDPDADFADFIASALPWLRLAA